MAYFKRCRLKYAFTSNGLLDKGDLLSVVSTFVDMFIHRSISLGGENSLRKIFIIFTPFIFFFLLNYSYFGVPLVHLFLYLFFLGGRRSVATLLRSVIKKILGYYILGLLILGVLIKKLCITGVFNCFVTCMNVIIHVTVYNHNNYWLV